MDYKPKESCKTCRWFMPHDDYYTNCRCPEASQVYLRMANVIPMEDRFCNLWEKRPPETWWKAEADMNQKEHDRRMELAKREAAKAWCRHDHTSEANFYAFDTAHLVMEPALVESFARMLAVHMYEPHLGCATTAALLSEIRARIEPCGKLGHTATD